MYWIKMRMGMVRESEAKWGIWCPMMERSCAVFKHTSSRQKIFETQPIKGFNYKFIRIIVSEGRIREELGKFFRFIKNLLKLDNK